MANVLDSGYKPVMYANKEIQTGS